VNSTPGQAGGLQGLPCAAGVGLKPQHFREVLQRRPTLGFFEIHAENYMVEGGPFHHFLRRIRDIYPLSLHGVGLSIGGIEPLDQGHLDRLAALAARYQPAVVSEHLAWSSHGGVYFSDLLPVRYDAATLACVCAHVDRLQQRLERQVLLENPSTYVEWRGTDYSETQFLAEVVRRTGCALLLDVNNVYVSCVNHGRDAFECIEELPLQATRQIHLAGFTEDCDAAGDRLLIDTHGSAVDAQVWELYRQVIDRIGPVPTLIEWDRDVPALDVLLREAERAQAILRQEPASRRVPALELRP
jgi:uncharacterized protein (UPF0276 family)